MNTTRILKALRLMIVVLLKLRAKAVDGERYTELCMCYASANVRHKMKKITAYEEKFIDALIFRCRPGEESWWERRTGYNHEMGYWWHPYKRNVKWRVLFLIALYLRVLFGGAKVERLGAKHFVDENYGWLR